MEDFSKVLILWYLRNKRNLPWRNTQNPYFIWLSEIILQQTRVEQGLPYYEKFILEFPQVADLANAPQEKVLRLWQGLGYYSRARNLQTAARQMIEDFNGKFPDSYNNIRSLKGVGDYTAAAIASFAFNLPYAVVDGNVYRFLSRYFGISTAIDSTKGKKEFAELAFKLLNPIDPGTHNQAMMEFGATVCKPSNPLCNECPFAGGCEAYKKGIISLFPVKEKKTKVRTRHLNYLIIEDNESLLIEERKAKDIWKGLFQFPLIETSNTADIDLMLQSDFLKNLTKEKVVFKSVSEDIKHQLSHQILYARFWHFKIRSVSAVKNEAFLKVGKADLDYFGMPQLIVKYLSRLSKKTMSGK